MKRINAPFTPEQVANLNAYQKRGDSHPFTCGSAKRCVEVMKMGTSSFSISTTLVATEAGWICPNCDYTQDWAWEFMAQPTDEQQPTKQTK